MDAGRGLCSTGSVTCPEPRNRWMEPWPLPTLWEVHQNSGEGLHPRPPGSPHSCQAWRGGAWEGEGGSTAFLVSWTITPFFCRTPGSHVLVSVSTYPGSQPGAAPWSSSPYLRGADLGVLGCQGHRDSPSPPQEVVEGTDIPRPALRCGSRQVSGGTAGKASRHGRPCPDVLN